MTTEQLIAVIALLDSDPETATQMAFALMTVLHGKGHSRAAIMAVMSRALDGVERAADEVLGPEKQPASGSLAPCSRYCEKRCVLCKNPPRVLHKPS